MEINYIGKKSFDVCDILGGLLTFHFYGEEDTNNTWLEAFANGESSDETTVVIPFDSQLVALSYGNEENDTGSRIRILKNTTNRNNYEYQWLVENSRWAWKSDVDLCNSDVTFNAGDRLRVYARNKSGQDEPEHLNIMVILKISSNIGSSGNIQNGV